MDERAVHGQLAPNRQADGRLRSPRTPRSSTLQGLRGLQGLQGLQGRRVPGRFGAGRQGAAGLVLLALLALPSLRHPMEVSMARHMLLQFPLLALAGALLAGACTDGCRRRLKPWNAMGISGLVFAGLVLALAMVPRLLDLALVDWRVEFGKWLALILCGAALRLSWRPAGIIVQGFFLGNVLPMTAVVGTLFQDSPVRLCNSYLLDEQLWVGSALVWAAGLLALGWLARVAARFIDRPGSRA